MALMWLIALDLTISQMAPLVSCQENSGSSRPAGTTEVRFRRLLRGQSLSCGVRKMDCVSPAQAVFAEGRSNQAYGLLSRSWPRKASFQMMCVVPLKVLEAMTETSLKCIIPQKVQAAMAHTQALTGSDRASVALRACSIGTIIGGHIGCWRRAPCKFSRPHRDQLIWSI